MRTVAVSLALMLAALGCGATPQDIEDLKKGQKDIMARLDALDRTMQQAKAPAAPARPQLDPNKVYSIPPGDSPVKGPRTAKVTITEFADYQCPFCAQAAGLPDEVLKAFPKDVNFVYKHFPLPATMHPQALPAAKAAVAAQRQGKFWEMHAKLFANIRELGADKYKEWAREIGLDVARFEQDIASPEVEKIVQQDMAVGQAAEVRGTPTFFVNGKLVVNRSVEGFKEMVEAALKEGEKKG